MMIPVAVIFGIIGLGLFFYVTRMIGGTQYIAKRADDTSTNPNELREQRKKAVTKKVVMLFGVWMGACLFSFLIVAMIPRIQTVKAALGPSATPTATNTSTPTRTPRPSKTPTRTPTLGTPGTSAPSGTPVSSKTATSAPATPTPQVIVQNNNVPVTVIVKVQQTVVMYVPVTVIVVVTATPTHTPSPTATLETFTPTITPTVALPTAFIPTGTSEIASPFPTIAETPTGVIP